MATRKGTSGRDRISGTASRDYIYGFGANDTLSGLGGNDSLKGGSGNDTLKGGSGHDVLYGDNGADRLLGSAGNDILHGGTGSDRLDGGSGKDVLHGDAGNDRLEGGAGNDRLIGGSGSDTLIGGSGNDTYDLTAGDRIIELARGGTDTVRVSGRSGYTLSTGVENLLVLDTNDDKNIYRGNNLDNRIDGRQTATNFNWDIKLYGLGGDDRLIGSAGDDYLDGGSGRDIMQGGRGDDTYVVDNRLDSIIEIDSHPIANGSAHDLVLSTVTYRLPNEVEDLTLRGSADLQAVGNSGNNHLIGNSGDNVLRGMAGIDQLTGGAGADRFVWGDIFEGEDSTSSDFVDHIVDFSAGEGDRIDLRLIDANPTLPGDQAFTFVGDIRIGGFPGLVVGEVGYIIGTSSTVIYVNTDADPSAEMKIVTERGGGPDASWFLL